jgi:hypothetical protein
MEFLLPKEQLKGLTEEEQKSVKDEALNQFLLGSIFGGGGIATGYQAVQNIIPNMQKQRQQQGLLQELTGIQNEFFPTEQQLGERALRANAPIAADEYGFSIPLAGQAAAARQPAPNYADLQTRLARLALNPTAAPIVPSLQSSFGAFKPTITDGVATDIRNQPISVIPRADLKTGLSLGGTVKNGNVSFSASDIAGFADAAARNQLPPLVAGTRFVFDDFGRRIGVTNDPGAVPASIERTLAEKRAEGQARLETTPTNVIDVPSGRQKRVTEAQALGMPTALSPSEVIAYQAYEPIRADAFKKFQAASSSDTSLQNMRNILNRGGFKPGRFAEAQSEIASIATGLGVGGQAAKNMATDAPLLLQTFADTVSTNIQDMSGAISNADVIFQKQRGPQIRNPEEALEYYIDLKESLNKRSKDYYNYVAKNPVPDVVEKWSQTPQGSASLFEDPKMRKYLPKFPVTQGPDKGKTAYKLPTGSIVLFD